MKYFQLYSTIYEALSDPKPPALNAARGTLYVKPLLKVTQGGVVPAKDQRPYLMDWPLHTLSQAEFTELENLPE